MIKAIIGNGILLGLDKENIKRLKEGAPILIKGSDIGLEVNVLIAYGDTLSDIQKELSPSLDLFLLIHVLSKDSQFLVVCLYPEEIFFQLAFFFLPELLVQAFQQILVFLHHYTSELYLSSIFQIYHLLS